MTNSAPLSATAARPRRWSRVTLTVLLIGLTLVAARAIVSAEPSEAELVVPFVATGAIGDTVEVGSFSVTVLSVRGAPLVQNASYTYTNTSGVFIAVKVRIVAHGEADRIRHVSVFDGASVVYEPTSRVPQHMQVRTYQPDVPVEGDFVFEVPKTVATSLTIRFADAVVPKELAPYGEIPLAITPDLLATWLSLTEPMAPEDPKVAA